MKLKWTPIRVVLLVLLVVVFLNTFDLVAQADTSATEVAEITRETTTTVNFTASTTSYRANGLTCWRGTHRATSPSLLGPRANWGVTAEWCSNGAVVKKVVSKRCFDRGGGIFTYDRTIECSRSAVGFRNVHINAVLRYTRTVWTPFPVEVTRFAHTSMWLGPKGGMSGSYWWSS